MAKTMHIKEMQRQLDVARIYRQTVNLRCWKMSTGDIIDYEGWLVKGSYWRGGTHMLLNPRNGQMREVRDCMIFEFMNHTIYW